MRKHGMFTPHGGDRAQQPQVKHDKRKPGNPRVDRDLGVSSSSSIEVSS